MYKYFIILFLFVLIINTNAQIIWEPTELSAICPGITVDGNGDIYAGDITGKFWKSTDNGENWTSVNTGITFQIADMAIASNGNIFVTTGGDETGNGVYKSTDNGSIWQHCTMTAGVVARDIKIKSGIIFVSTKDNGLGKSTDNGTTWTGASSSVPEGNVGAFNITNNGTLILGVKGSNGVYRSTDDGASWTLTNFPQSKRVYSLTVASNNYIFAGTKEYYDGVYKSTDDGATWQKITSLPQNIEYSSNGISTSDNKIYIGVLNVGVYCSSDFGDTWQLYADGFGSLYGFKLAEGSDGSIFATAGDGVYKSNGTTGVEEVPLGTIDFKLFQNYPNPFNPTTRINYNITSTQFVSLKIYDVIGNEVAVIVNELQNPGSHSINFTAEGLSSGIYFYKLKAGSYLETKSMILMK